MTPADEVHEPLSADAITRRLAGVSHEIRLHLFDETDSTNERAREFLSSGAKGPACAGLFAAESQTAGRGRFGRRWSSPARRNLLFSLALPSPVPPSPGILSLACGAAVCRALERADASLAPTIKWPNDVRLSGRKLAGVLIEALHSQSGRGGVVIGIGINVNMTAGDMPDEIRATATTLRDATGRKWPREDLLAQVIFELFAILAEPEPARTENVLREVSARDDLRGSKVRFDFSGEMVTAVAEGIGPEGELLARTASGEFHRLRGGEVTLAKDSA